MASISSLMGSSSSSSIYGTRNVISGLASGLDTETLIENAVSGYKLKITSLQQQRTKVGWQQDAYRSMISKMVNFTQKYTSYTSGTNLLSSNFFDSAVNTVSNGANASKVSATGKTSSDVRVNSVSQLATAARYSTVGNLKPSNVAAEPAFNMSDEKAVGLLNGSLKLGYGGKTVSISFDEGDAFNTADEMAAKINKKLEEQTISFDSGTQEKASERIRAVAENGTIKFETVKANDGNGVWISSSTGSKMQDALGVSITDSDDTSVKSFNFEEQKAEIVGKKTVAELIKEEGFSIVVDGKSTNISFSAAELKDNDTFLAALQEKVTEASNGKLDVNDLDDDVSNGIQLSFSADKNVKFQVTSGADEAMGMEGGLTSYINTNRKVSELIELNASLRTAVDADKVKQAEGKDYYEDADGNRVKKDETDGKWYQVNSADEFLYDFKVNGESVATITEDTTLAELMDSINKNENSDITMAYSSFTGKFTFTAKDTGADGDIDFGTVGLAAAMFGGTNSLDTSETKAKELLGYETLTGRKFSINVEGLKDPVEFTFKGETGSLDDVLGRINEQFVGTDLEASYSDVDGSLVVRNKNTDEELDVTYGEGVAQDLFSAIAEKNGYTLGQDAKFNVTVNGETREVTQSSNTVDIDGMNLTLKGTFEADPTKENDGAVTFTTSADADKIVDVVKQLVEDYNALATEIKNAYSTLPLQNSSGEYYQPLTDDDRADMTESAINAYEENAKTGLLFGDRDLASLYSGLRDAISVLGVSGNDAQALGITTSYSNGLTTLALDENALRQALADDPDKVKDVFTRSKSNGASTDGLMQGLKTVMDKYAGTTGAVKGILIQKAGSTLAPTSIYQNTLQTKLDDLDTQIEKWQDKISDQIDFYTSKFTALEQLVAQMNNQSSMLMGLTGGY